MKRKHLFGLALVWSILVVVSYLWNYTMIISNNEKVVLNKSRAFFEQILITRAWNSSLGGVYAPVSEKTKPNSYLIDSLRDLTTTTGMQLTKINPAFMTRQIAEINKSKNNLQFHITSLNPIRHENGADEWETEALTKFEKGEHEVLELVKIGNTPQYRYMAPLITERSCLKCHAVQGYSEGDIRGGISVSYPATIFLSSVNSQLSSISIIHLIILVLGILGLWGYYRLSNNYYTIIRGKNEELMQINATKDKFFSIIAHDLRSPFTIILGYSELLANEYDKISEEERHKFIDDIYTSTHKTFDLVENLLLWARSQRDKIEIKSETLNLKSIVDESISAYRYAADKKNIRIEIDVDNSIYVVADIFTTKIAIVNLFNNSIKFTPPSGIIKIRLIPFGQVKFCNLAL